MIDKKDKKSIKAILDRGAKTEFWAIILEALDETIVHLQDELNGENIQGLPADEYKFYNELLKTKIAYLNKLKRFPQTLGTWIAEPNQTSPNFDPYLKPADFIRKSKEIDV